MGSITGEAILIRAAVLLLDVQNKRWRAEELLDWLNDGQRTVVFYRPDASTTISSFPLVTGTKQSLPTNGLRLVEVIRNMGVDGNTPGKPIRFVNRDELDLLNPNWHTDAGVTEVDVYMYDGRAPKTFYVYPPQPAAPRQIEAAITFTPADVRVNGVNGQTVSDAIVLDDIYQTGLVDYIIYRALAKDSAYQDVAKSQNHWQNFAQSLGIKVDIDRAFDPRRNAPPKDVATGEPHDTAF